MSTEYWQAGSAVQHTTKFICCTQRAASLNVWPHAVYVKFVLVQITHVFVKFVLVKITHVFGFTEKRIPFSESDMKLAGYFKVHKWCGCGTLCVSVHRSVCMFGSHPLCMGVALSVFACVCVSVCGGGGRSVCVRGGEGVFGQLVYLYSGTFTDVSH